MKEECKNKIIYSVQTTTLGQNRALTQAYPVLNVLVSFFCPVIFCVIFTGLLVKFISKRKQVRKTVLTPNSAANNGKYDKDTQLDNLTVVLIAVAVCFVMCILPVSLILFVYYIVPLSLCSAGSYTLVALQLLSILNSSANFLIFFWKIPSFRKSAKSLFCKIQEDEFLPSEVEMATAVSTSI